MNNAQITTTIKEEDRNISPELEQKKSEIEITLENLRFLKHNAEFAYYKKMIYTAEIDNAVRKLKQEKDKDNILRLQGFIISTEALFDLAKLEQFYQARLEEIKGRLAEENKKKK